MHACARDPRFLVGWPQNLARRAAWLCLPLRSTPESLTPTRSGPFPGRCTVVRRPHGGRPLPRGTSCAAPPQAVLTPCQALVGFLQAEALRLQGAVFLQPAVDAFQTIVERFAQRLPSVGLRLRVGGCQHSEEGLHLNGCAHGFSLLLPFQHEPVAGGTAAVLRRRGSATAQTQRRIVAFASRFLAQNSHLPFPKIDGRGGVEKRFAGTQLELAQGSGTSGPSKAAELQALHMEDKADVLPAENGAENLIQFVQREGVGHRDDADDHRTHVAKNSSKNQSLEGGACAHSFTLPAPVPARPRVAAALLDRNS